MRGTRLADFHRLAERLGKSGCSDDAVDTLRRLLKLKIALTGPTSGLG